MSVVLFKADPLGAGRSCGYRPGGGVLRHDRLVSIWERDFSDRKSLSFLTRIFVCVSFSLSARANVYSLFVNIINSQSLSSSCQAKSRLLAPPLLEERERQTDKKRKRKRERQRETDRDRDRDRDRETDRQPERQRERERERERERHRERGRERERWSEGREWLRMPTRP